MDRTARANIALIAAKAELLHTKAQQNQTYTSDVQRELDEIARLCRETRDDLRNDDPSDR